MVVSLLARWHALWLIPVATCGFAVAYERWLWDEPAGIPSGMDGIGYYPTSVSFGLIFVVPFTLLVLVGSSAPLWWRGRPSANASRAS